MSVRAKVLNIWLKYTEKRSLARIDSPAKLRRSFERKSRILFRSPRDVTYEFNDLNAADGPQKSLWIKPKRLDEGPLVFYIHGGAYVFGSPTTHRAMIGYLRSASSLSACLPTYRLAPEHRFPTAADDVIRAYLAIADHPRGVVIGGDSAGGGLALALLHEILQRGLPKPIGVFAFSPLTDMTFSGGSYTRNAKTDVVLTAAKAHDAAHLYLNGSDPRDPRASPLFGTYSEAPPVWLTAGDTEFLLDDTIRMATKLRDQNVNVTEIIQRDLPHVWPIFQGLMPEAKTTLDDLAKWITALSRQ